MATRRTYKGGTVQEPEPTRAPRAPRNRYKGDPERDPNDPEPVDAKEAAATRKWKRELALARKREKDWRLEGEKIVKRYRGEEQSRNRYNVLWANTDVLLPAIYNSKPDPDVRRRFRDADVLGKAVGEVLERALAVVCDGDATDDSIKGDVLDGLLCGRGVSRVRYVPKLAPSGSTEPAKSPEETDQDEDDDEQSDAAADLQGDSDDGGGSEPVEPDEGSYEQVEFEQVVLEHVDWQDFAHGYGRVWDEVEWEGFRHELTRTDAEKLLGKEAIKGIKFSPAQVADDKKFHEEAATVSKVAEFWEIWDKTGEKVFFLHEDAKRRLYPVDTPDGEPPLQLEGFFCTPKPLILVPNTGSLIPTPMFHLYEDQANSLDALSFRIDKIIKALRLRGLYDSKLAEIPDLLAGEDNQLTPVQNAQQWADAGGIDRAITWMPVDQAVKVLEALYDARTRQKAVIDELTGISDIVRGTTDPDETLGAQELKSGYFSIRHWRLQNEVKRYGRDLLRLAAQVMAQRFGIDTFQAMTDLKFPTNQDKAGMLAKLQMLMQPPPMLPPPGAPGPMPPPALQHMPPPQAPAPPGAPPASPGPAPQGPTPSPGVPPGAPPAVIGAGAPPGAPGAPPPPNPAIANLQTALKVPAWEDIIAMLRSPALRQFRVDVETDSMIAGTMQADMGALSGLLKAIADTLQGLAPLISAGALPADAAKEIVMSVIRRARMGTAVEDAFDKLQAPKPPPPPGQVEAQARLAEVQAKGSAEQQLEQLRQQGENTRQALAEHAKTQREQTAEMSKNMREDLDRRFDAFVDIVKTIISATKRADPAVEQTADRVVLEGGRAGPAGTPPPGAQANGIPPALPAPPNQ
jgi:hypothetical protein